MYVYCRMHILMRWVLWSGLEEEGYVFGVTGWVIFTSSAEHGVLREVRHDLELCIVWLDCLC